MRAQNDHILSSSSMVTLPSSVGSEWCSNLTAFDEPLHGQICEGVSCRVRDAYLDMLFRNKFDNFIGFAQVGGQWLFAIDMASSFGGRFDLGEVVPWMPGAEDDNIRLLLIEHFNIVGIMALGLSVSHFLSEVGGIGVDMGDDLYIRQSSKRDMERMESEHRLRTVLHYSNFPNPRHVTFEILKRHSLYSSVHAAAGATTIDQIVRTRDERRFVGTEV